MLAETEGDIDGDLDGDLLGDLLGDGVLLGLCGFLIQFPSLP